MKKKERAKIEADDIANDENIQRFLKAKGFSKDISVDQIFLELINEMRRSTDVK